MKLKKSVSSVCELGGGSPSLDLADIVTGKSETQRLEEEIKTKRSIHDFG